MVEHERFLVSPNIQRSSRRDQEWDGKPSLCHWQVQVDHDGLSQLLPSNMGVACSNNGTIDNTCLPSAYTSIWRGSSSGWQSVVKVKRPLPASPRQVNQAHLGRQRIRVRIFPGL